MLQDNTPDSIGAQILARYQHPASWEDGSATGKGDLVGKKVLKVEEIRMGGFAFVSALESEANAKAILAWAASVGIKAYELTG